MSDSKNQRFGFVRTWRICKILLVCFLYAGGFFFAEQVLTFLNRSEMRNYDGDVKRIPLWEPFCLCEESPGVDTFCLLGRRQPRETSRKALRKEFEIVVSGIKLLGIGEGYVWGLRRKDSLLGPVSGRPEDAFEYFYFEKECDATIFGQARQELQNRVDRKLSCPLQNVDDAWYSYWETHGQRVGLCQLVLGNIGRNELKFFLFDVPSAIILLFALLLQKFRRRGGKCLKFIQVVGFSVVYIVVSAILTPLSLLWALLLVICMVFYGCLNKRESSEGVVTVYDVIANWIIGGSKAVLLLGGMNYILW